MNPSPAPSTFHSQELRIALVMNGGVSLAVWIGGVTHEINRLVRHDSVYGLLSRGLFLRPRVDIISGTSAGGINGGALALAMSQGKPLDPLREIWLERGDIATLLRKSTEVDAPSLLEGAHFYGAMLEGFQKIRDQQGPGLQPPGMVPIELTLTTTVLRGEVRDFPDDVGTVIRDVSHRGLMTFRRGPDLADDPFAAPDIVAKLAASARATASFPGAFEPFYLPADDEKVSAGGHKVPCLHGHANFTRGCFVVDGGVLDNSPLESAIEAVFRQRAEGEVRRVLAYVVPDPGHIPDPPSEDPAKIPTLVSTALASLVSIPRVESVSDQLRTIVDHNHRVSQQRDTRLLVARSLDWTQAQEMAKLVFSSYRLRRLQSAADYIALALAEGAARHRDASGQSLALGRRTRQHIAETLTRVRALPWLPDTFADATDTSEWHWGLFTLENVMSTLLDLLRRGVQLVPARRGESREELWQALTSARRRAFDLVAELARLRQLDRGHWIDRGTSLAPDLASLERGESPEPLSDLLRSEIRQWVRLFDRELTDNEPLRPPRAFTQIARQIGELLADSAPLLRNVLALGIPLRGEAKYAELTTLLNFLQPPAGQSPDSAWNRVLTLEVVSYAFGAETTRDQYLELVQFSANVPTAFGGPDRLAQKLAGVQVAHFGAFYKRSWRINDWMFGRLDGAERLVRIILDPSRLARIFSRDPQRRDDPDGGIAAALAFLKATVLEGVIREDDRQLLQRSWASRLEAMTGELAFLENGASLPDNLPECSAMVVECLHLAILRDELPALADAVGDDELDGSDRNGNGSKFLKRFQRACCANPATGSEDSARQAAIADLPADQLISLFKGAKVGEEKILEEVGTDRFTIMATQSAAVAVAALSGKSSGLGLLRAVFAVARTPLVTLALLLRALVKKHRVFLSLYAMAMAASATILLSWPLAGAQWPSLVTLISVIILLAGFIVLPRVLAKR